MAKKLFVGGLSWNTGDRELESCFARFGQISDVKVITDRDTGRSRGFGFVTFENEQDAEAAIETMDGAELDSRSIKVSEAKERERRPRYERSF